VALSAVLAAALLRAVGPEEAIRTDVRTAGSGIALGALAVAGEGLADRIVQAVALHRAVPAVPAGWAIYRRVDTNLVSSGWGLRVRQLVAAFLLICFFAFCLEATTIPEASGSCRFGEGIKWP